MIFNDQEWQRYQRHVQLGKFGAEGQKRLKQSHVLIVGVGGLGCPAAQYLGAAGVGRITLVDADEISRTNLQRQVLFADGQVGESKAAVAKARLLANNPHIQVEAVESHLTLDNAEALIAAVDLVVDCTDNFATRYLVNDMCHNLGKPWVYASVVQFSGQVALFAPGSACFRCLFPETPQGVADCNSAGVLGTLPGLLAMLQANEAIKFLAGLATPLENTLMLVEGLSMDFRKIKLKRNAQCVCSHSQIAIADHTADYEFICETTEGNDLDISATEFEQLRQEEHRLLDVRSSSEHEGFNLGGDNLPLSDNFASDYAEYLSNKQVTYLLYCQSGLRSRKAAEQLRAAGYAQVHSLKNGLGGYLASQLSSS